MWLAALLLTATLQDPVNDGAAGAFYSYIDGQRWTFVVSRENLRNSPRWSVDDDSPPLAPRQAEKAAASLMERLLSDGASWRRTDISLRQILWPDAWIYLVEFSSPMPPPSTPLAPGQGVVGSYIPKTMRVVVLMDGRAVNPIILP